MAAKPKPPKLKPSLTGFDVYKLVFFNKHFYDSHLRMGRKDSSFGYVLKGNVTLHSMGKSMRICENELFFIPQGITYTSEWYGYPDIQFYSIRIIEKEPDITENPDRFALQRIDAFCNTETGERINEIYQLIISENYTDKLRALGLFYLLYADIHPHLTKAPPIKFNSVLSEARRYILQNYREDFSIEELAAACSISASRLFHLFRSVLNTTPIKYRNVIRVEYAAKELRDTDNSMDEIAAHHGFHSATYFREIFKECTKLTPSQYRAMTHSKTL